MLFVYLFDNHPRFAQRVEEIYLRMQRQTDILCSSPLVFAEVLAGPVITGNVQEQQMVTGFFQSREVSLVNFSLDCVPVFAQLRAAKVKSADAMHIAMAAAAKVDLFLTNDTRLAKLQIPGLPFIASLETDIF